jgi:D-erythro-7,8-dihydroneopterin triphosphate epimerase
MCEQPAWGREMGETVESRSLDRIVIRDLLVRGIVGINPEERRDRQDVLVNVTIWADTRRAAASDDIADAVNYRTIAKAMIAAIESSQPCLVERLAADLAAICFAQDARVQAVEVSVEKPGALRFARSVGVVIYRERGDPAG